MRTAAPRKGVEARSEAVGELAADLFKLSISAEMGSYLSQLEDAGHWERLSDMDRRLAHEVRKYYDRSVKIPPELYQEYVTLTSKAEAVCEEAKPKSDFAAFAPYLEKSVDYTKQFVDLWGYQDHKYNTLVDLYEPGMTVDVLDRVFRE